MADIVQYQEQVALIDTFRNFDGEALKRLDATDREIVRANDYKRFRDYAPEELMREVAKCLQLILRDIGYKGTEADIRYILMTAARILPKYYGGLTLKDFALAFELLAVGELDGYLPRNSQGEPDRKHYQQVNAEYLCRVLNAYKAKRSQALKEAEKVRPVQVLEANPEAAKDAERKIAERLDAAIAFYKAEGRFPVITLIDEKLFFEMLVKAGEVEGLEAPSDEQAILLEEVITEKANGCLGRRNKAFERFFKERKRRLYETIKRLANDTGKWRTK